MNEWQRSFLGKLESARKHWVQRFEETLDDHVQLVYDEFADFTSANGFQTSAPACETGARIFKFGLTENGYVLVSFHLRGLDAVEATAEFFVPGAANPEPTRARTSLEDVSAEWARRQFEKALDRFVVSFTEASAACTV